MSSRRLDATRPHTPPKGSRVAVLGGKMRRTICGASVWFVLSGLVAIDPASARVAPRPVSPEQALVITEQLAAKAPPLPPEIAAQLAAEAPRFPQPGEPVPAAGDARDGKGCLAQGFGPGGTLVSPREVDLNGRNGIEPWERDPNRNETCVFVPVWVWQPNSPETGSMGYELRTETDEATGKVYERIVGRSNGEPKSHAHGDCSDATQTQYDTAVKLVEDTKQALSIYENNPLLASAHGFWPYPIPGTKKFHWFNSPRFNDAHTLNPQEAEMFVATITDDGWVPVNVSYIWTYNGQNPRQHNPNVDRPATNNAGAGCFMEWHAHSEGAEGAATANFEGRTWMGHLWFYGGVDPFGDRDMDGSEAHGWYAPLNDVMALCNTDGGCI